jgi:hypothetical protein
MEQLKLALPEFHNIKYTEINGLTHKQLRVEASSLKHFKYDFIADIFINKRTLEHSIARIDTKDTQTLKKIVSIFQS